MTIDRFKPTLENDGGTGGSGLTLTQVPGASELTQRNISGLPRIEAPNLQVYRPDFSGLEQSFNQIMQSYEQFRGAAQSQFDTQRAGLDTSLEQSMRNIQQAKEKTTQQFGKSRAQLAEDVFAVNRQTQAQMSARGLGGSGIEAMANIQNRMAAGESISEMANDYFDAQTQLVQAEEDTRTNYNNSLMALNSSLQSAMAQIMSQEASSRMDYTQMVEGLKRQVIADTNSANEAMAQWRMAQSQLEQGAQITNTMVSMALSSPDLTDEDKISALMDMRMTRPEAVKALNAWKSQSESSLYAQIQKEIDNRWALSGSSQASINKYISDLVNSGVPVDVNRLRLSKPVQPKEPKQPRQQTNTGVPTSAPGVYRGFE